MLEMQAHRLWHDALRLQNAALCGTATTNFLDVMENFYGVDETEEETRVEIIKQNKEERSKELQSKNLSVTKGSVKHEEVGE